MNEKNNFDIVRVVLAFIVMLVHSAEVTRNQSLSFFADYLNSDFAVKGFFAISGYLIARSYIRSSGLVSYALKRARRILPAYFFVILCCFLIGLFLTTYQPIKFILDSGTIKYLAANLTFLNFAHPSLPGVFSSNPNQSMDGSLWTIKAEITLYIILPFVIPFIQKNYKLTISIILLIAVSWFLYFTKIYHGPKGGTIAKQFVYLSSFFFVGSLYSLNEVVFKRIGFITIVSLCCYFIFRGSSFNVFIEMIAFPSVVIYACTSFFKEIHINKVGDLSYGIYLYHWPIIQLIQHYGIFDRHPYLGEILLVISTCSVSYLSWHLLENKFLKRKSVEPSIEPITN